MDSFTAETSIQAQKSSTDREEETQEETDASYKFL